MCAWSDAGNLRRRDIPSRRSTEIIDLAENRGVVLVAQYFTAKILKRVKLVTAGFCGRFSSLRVKILNSRELSVAGRLVPSQNPDSQGVKRNYCEIRSYIAPRFVGLHARLRNDRTEARLKARLDVTTWEIKLWKPNVAAEPLPGKVSRDRVSINGTQARGNGYGASDRAGQPDL